ncbi:hypothetical protein J2W46_006285 [Paraburkholderia strydomiana]|nr:hypothetical protein [Paraburkholderia strydomiana]
MSCRRTEQASFLTDCGYRGLRSPHFRAGSFRDSAALSRQIYAIYGEAKDFIGGRCVSLSMSPHIGGHDRKAAPAWSRASHFNCGV